LPAPLSPAVPVILLALGNVVVIIAIFALIHYNKPVAIKIFALAMAV
jgi:hypothetical protein